jgi:hypothetical protein
MMSNKIGSENGIEGTRKRLQTLDPQTTEVAAYNRLLGKPGQLYPGDPTPVEGTLATLVNGHNEYADRLAAVEARLVSFPFEASS